MLFTMPNEKQLKQIARASFKRKIGCEKIVYHIPCQGIIPLAHLGFWFLLWSRDRQTATLLLNFYLSRILQSIKFSWWKSASCYSHIRHRIWLSVLLYCPFFLLGLRCCWYCYYVLFRCIERHIAQYIEQYIEEPSSPLLSCPVSPSLQDSRVLGASEKLLKATHLKPDFPQVNVVSICWPSQRKPWFEFQEDLLCQTLLESEILWVKMMCDISCCLRGTEVLSESLRLE